MHLNFHTVTGWIWMCLGVFWIVGWLGAKASVRTQPSASRLLQLSFEIVALTLLFGWISLPSFLTTRLFPESSTTGWLGVVLTFIGALFAVWARLTLGTNWSARVTITEQHELIRSGPYALVRHPIYSGLLLMVLGTAIEIGKVRGFVSLAFAFTGWFLKSRTEDSFMQQQFGDEYVRYKSRVKAIVPGIF